MCQKHSSCRSTAPFPIWLQMAQELACLGLLSVLNIELGVETGP